MADAAEPLRKIALPEAPLDRDAARRVEADVVGKLLDDPQAVVLELVDGRAQVVEHDGGLCRLATRAPLPADRQWCAAGGLTAYLGRVAGRAVVAVLRQTPSDPHSSEADATATPVGQEDPTVSLRQVALALPEADLAVFRTALALFHWHERHPHCPRCGGGTTSRQAGWTRVCEVDGSEHFPRTDPAVIMAVVDESDRLLLARGSRWNGPHRSVLAGFVEPGETFEQAVARETLEESGVVVDDVTYVGNQPWPFPASLMIGFMARARTLELTPEPGEIEEIAWYSRADVDAGLAEGTLQLPGRLSIARTLIETWYGAPIDAEDFS